jgi:GxxExxY protein
MVQSNYIHSEITDKIINCFYTVYNELGYGFLEKVYERALIIELVKAGFHIASQKCFKVYYHGEVVGNYVPDILVEGLVVIEVKAVITIHHSHEDQLKNALRATDFEVGLLFNFGVVPQLKRKVFANEFKKRKARPSHKTQSE